MHDLPRQKLTELLSTHGLGICDDVKRFEGLLKDLLRNGHKREIFILVSAVREGIVQELHGLTSGLPLAALTARLVQELRDNLALDEAAARWAVESWAFAMGVKITPQVAPAKKTTQAPPLLIPTASPEVTSGKGIDLAAMVLQQRANEDQEKRHAEAIHQKAKELADVANDYEAALGLLESLDAKRRDQRLYDNILKRLSGELEAQAKQHADEVHRHAKQFAEQSRDFAGAARLIETLEPKWRDTKLYGKICGYRDQVVQLDARIHDAVRKGRLGFLRGRVQKLLELQPQREDMRRLLEVLPAEAELEQEFTNSIGMRFVLIQPGEFMMGSNEFENEKPPHVVRITEPFYMAAFPVTQAEYLTLMEANPSCFRENNCPVETVSWEEAEVFCEKLSQLPAESDRELTYRLPTEAEWEYACRAGSSGKWCFGSDVSLLREFAWFDVNSDGRTHPVGEKQANNWGLYDMHGNVSEWCEDGFVAGYRMDSSKDAKSMAKTRACRGGSWNLGDLSCRSANRNHYGPKFRRHYIGFRVVAIPGEN